jgi:hypothetical protein
MESLLEKLSRLKELVEEYEKLDNQIGGWKEDEYIKDSDLKEIFEIIKSL